MVFFSIIIPTFNSQETLRFTLDSIFNQRFNDYEILVLDGLSSDDTVSIVNNFKDLRIKFNSSPDFGTYDAMNKGIKLAKGRWIYFLGSDDAFYNEFVLEEIFNALQFTALPVVYGNVKILGNTGWSKDGEIYAGYFSKNRMLKRAICHQAVFYNREFLIQNNLSFNLKYFVSADWDFNLRCRRISKFKYVDLIIAVFKAGGISSKKRDSFLDEIHNEFSDMFPSKFEIFVKRLCKKIISFFK